MAEGDDEKTKCKEDWLRQELRANRTLMTGLLQWGVAVLAAVQLNLYYIRRDVTRHLVERGRLKADELLPFTRWLTGTIFLMMLAYIFTSYMRTTIERHANYRKQLLIVSPTYS